MTIEGGERFLVNPSRKELDILSQFGMETSQNLPDRGKWLKDVSVEVHLWFWIFEKEKGLDRRNLK